MYVLNKHRVLAIQLLINSSPDSLDFASLCVNLVYYVNYVSVNNITLPQCVTCFFQGMKTYLFLPNVNKVGLEKKDPTYLCMLPLPHLFSIHQCVVSFAVCFGSLSCWQVNLVPVIPVTTFCRGQHIFLKTWQYFAPSILSDKCSNPCCREKLS